MQMTGEQRIAAPRETVWQALNDPEVLKACIPGCEEIEKVSDTEMNAKVRAKVGPVSARFQGSVTLSDLNPPESYRISGEGKGGPAGFAKGGATVHLAEDGADATLLSYEVDAQVGGKLAQIGGRLIDGTAKKLAGDFFTALDGYLTSPAEEAEAEAEAAEAEQAAEAHAGHAPPEPIHDPNVGAGVKPGIWITGLIVVVILLLFIFGLGGGETPH